MRRIAALLFAVLLASQAAAQERYPSQPVTLISPYPPGGAADFLARVLAEGLKGRLNQSVIVQNVGGAGGTVGTLQAARAKPDGYTLLLHHIGMSTIPALYKKLTFDPTIQRYTEPYMNDNDDKNTGGKYRMTAVFAKAVTMAAATKGMRMMVGSGVDGSTFPHGTQALEFDSLVKRGGMSPVRAIQSGTIVNAEALGWSDRIGSIEKGKYADVIAVSGNPLTDITELQRATFVMRGGKVIRDETARRGAAR